MKLEDVARLAKVSKSAASLALNGKPGVSEETRHYILQVAKENNYIPWYYPFRNQSYFCSYRSGQ